MRLGHAGHLFVEAAVGVEQIPLCPGIEKLATFELAVDLDQAVAERALKGNADRLVVYERARSAVRAHNSAEHDRVLGCVQSVRFE